MSDTVAAAIDRPYMTTATGARAGRVRVLHIVLNIHEGGLERILGELVRRMDPDRFDVHVLALEYLGRLARGLERHVELHVCERLPRWSMLHPAPLIRQIRAIAPDLVHTHSGVWYKASLAARRAEVATLVHTDHGRPSPDDWQHRLTDRLASRRTDAVIAVSEPLARQLAQSVVAHPERIKVIANGIDTLEFTPSGDAMRLRRELGIPATAAVLGSIGRLDRIKGFDVMIEAFAHLQRGWGTGEKPVLIIAGDGPEMAALTELRAKHGLEGWVHLLGWREDVHDLLGSFDIFTLASRSEGTSISLLEAMSSGVCPVVTDVGGNPTVLGGALAHRLCPPESASSLSAAWANAIRDADGRRVDAMCARRRVAEAFSMEAMVRSHEQLYEILASRSGSGRA